MVKSIRSSVRSEFKIETTLQYIIILLHTRSSLLADLLDRLQYIIILPILYTSVRGHTIL